MQQTAKRLSIYAYRLTNDSGSAPCIFDLNGHPTGLLTLVCCKGGQIRYAGTPKEKGIETGLRHTIGKKYKEKITNGQDEVYLMGIYKNKLLYIAKITEILNMEDYYSSNSLYKNRLDYIYKALPGGFERNGNNPKFHPIGETAQHRKDRLGKYALISDCFAYWGKESKPIPQRVLSVLPKFQESKHYVLDTPEGKQLKHFIESMWNFSEIIQKEPHKPTIINCKGCVKK